MFCSDKDVIGKMNDVDSIVTFAKENKVDFVVLGPELPIEAGVADALRYRGIRCVGPRKVAGQLETSKSFTRDLVAKYDIPGNPKFKIEIRYSREPEVQNIRKDGQHKRVHGRT